MYVHQLRRRGSRGGGGGVTRRFHSRTHCSRDPLSPAGARRQLRRAFVVDVIRFSLISHTFIVPRVAFVMQRLPSCRLLHAAGVRCGRAVQARRCARWRRRAAATAAAHAPRHRAHRCVRACVYAL